MKKRICALLTLLLLFGFCLGGSALAEETKQSLSYVTDSAGLLTEEQLSSLESTAARLSREGKVALYIVTMDDYREYSQGSALDCAGELYDYFDLGAGEDRSGVLLLLSMKELDYAVTVRGDYAGYCFGEANLRLVEENFLNACRGENWAGGFETFLDLCGDVTLTAADRGLSVDQTDQSLPGLDHPENTYFYGVTDDAFQTDGTAETPEQASQETGEENKFSYITDSAGILTERERSTLETRAAQLSEEHGCSLYVVTVKDHSEFNPDVYEAAKGIYNYYDLGYGEGKDGVLLLLSLDERDYSFVGHGDKGETICGYESSWLVEDEFLDNFRRDDWYGGFSDYLEACGKQLTKLEQGEDITEGANIIVGPNGQEYHSYNAPGQPTRMPTGAKLGIGIGAPCLIALAICSTFKAQMKTAKEKTTAEEYVVPGSAALRVRDDRFINRTETRVPIHTESSSGRGGSSGGSSFHSGGGFSGRSGKF